MGVLREIWRRALSEQAAAPAAVVALTAVAALALVAYGPTWRIVRLLVTVTHEGAHAVAALLAGRRLSGIRLHSDTSGLTLSYGRPAGPGMVATLVAGYLGPAVVGLGAAWLLLAGHALGLLWLVVVVLALMLLKIRNLYGFAVVVIGGSLIALVSWYLTAPAQSAIAYLLTWLLLIAAPKPVLELMRQRRRGRAGHSDADQLARMTGVPGGLWTAGFLIANCTGLLLGIALLLPALVSLAQDAGASLLG